MDGNNIISFGTHTPAKPESEPTYDYQFTTKDGQTFTRHGVLTMNPLFFGVTTEDNRLIFSVAAETILTVDRLEPKPTLNA